ncbi:MAG: hypothetical protein JWP95_275 [Actinotalea sp.]|nr:hypothetical protein [Actinotalea sp.]
MAAGAVGELTLVTAMRSVTGAHRSSNQDSLGCAPGYMFVADGVGGHVGGDVASWTVSRSLMASLTTDGTRTDDIEHLRSAIADANAALGDRVERQPSLAGMATTFTGVFCVDDAVQVAHIGDSRAYLVRDGQGRRVTRDDSLVQKLVDSGVLAQGEADHHPQRNIILRSLGGSRQDAEALTFLTVPAEVGDRWLVASDGLTDYVPEGVVVDVLARAATPAEAADTLIAAATEADSRDNVSVAVSDVVRLDPTDAFAGEHQLLGAAASPDHDPAA